MRKTKSMLAAALVVVLALPVVAAPVTADTAPALTWWEVVSDAWVRLLSATFGASSTTDADPTTTQPLPDDGSTTNSTPPPEDGGDGEGRPGWDPDG